MAYPFVRAYFDYGPRRRPVLAFVVHMAEGGGTVGYLSRQNPNGVSVHYVVERSGRVVQMLREDRASGSIRPSSVRATDDPIFTSPDGDRVAYGASAAKAALGSYWRDPNSAVLSCEIEGFARDGPNAAQLAALTYLVADCRSRHPRMRLLGHRDFADYKACPGKRIRWGQLGGHWPDEVVRWVAKLSSFPFWLYEVHDGRITRRTIAARGGVSVESDTPIWADWPGHQRRKLVRLRTGRYAGRYVHAEYASSL